MADKIRLFYNIVQHSIQFLSLIYSVIYWKEIKMSNLKLFPLYIAISFLICLSWYFRNLNLPGIAAQNIFIIFESLIIYDFYIRIFNGKHNRQILVFLFIIFLILFIVISAQVYKTQNMYNNFFLLFRHRVLTEVFVIQSIIIVLPVLFYYKSLFNPPFIRDLRKNPIFLVNTGILFCFTITIPLFALTNVFMQYNRDLFVYLFMINSFSYIIMHLFFIKAFSQLAHA